MFVILFFLNDVLYFCHFPLKVKGEPVYLHGKVTREFMQMVTIRPLSSRTKATWEFVTQEPSTGRWEVRVYLTDTHMAEDKCISLHKQLNATNTAVVRGVKHLWPFLSRNTSTHTHSFTYTHKRKKERNPWQLRGSWTLCWTWSHISWVKPHMVCLGPFRDYFFRHLSGPQACRIECFINPLDPEDESNLLPCWPITSVSWARWLEIGASRLLQH